LELLSRDVRLFKAVSEELKDIEGEMIKLIQQTPARFVSGQIQKCSGQHNVWFCRFVCRVS